MSRKVSTCFKHIKFKDGILQKSSFEPSLINFIYGKNGTGKTTISRSFSNTSFDFEWAKGLNQDDVKVMVYNEDFISENIQSYGNIPGVFTITKQSAEDKAIIDNKKERLELVNKAINTGNEAVEGLQTILSEHKKEYLDTLWSKTDDIRRTKYPNTQKKTSKADFAALLENTQPVSHDRDELDQLYKMVFVDQASLHRAEPLTLLKPLPEPDNDLLEKRIVGLSDTPFADFVKKIGALDWVSSGHKQFHNASDGRCPYCQQVLPDDFEQQLADCYDEEYKKELDALRQYVSSYQSAIERMKSIINQNINNPFNCKYKSDFITTCQMLKDGIAHMSTTLQLKLESPGMPYMIDDVSEYVNAVNGIAESINKEIAKHNAIVADIPGKQQDCREKVFQLMAYLCREEILNQKALKTEAEPQLRDFIRDIGKYKEEADALNNEIAELNKSTINTTAAKDSINALIKSCGFRGFYLREKPGSPYVYELVREDNNGGTITIAKDLSEGERHFIAFLYFYHTVIGSQSDDGKVVPKIVVIDDPVSSLDSETMFIVGALTRELIGICYNNYRISLGGNSENYIKQFFCLTHNPYFFREISYNRLMEYECASFFELKKGQDNHSSIVQCTEKSSEVGGRIINRSPVRNYYDSLWNDYKSTDDPETLMTVIRQILEFYFIQLCGYKAGNLRSDLIDKNEELFISKNEDGSDNRTEYIIATAMISFLDSGADGFNEGLFYDSSSANVDQMRTVFRKLFEIKGQQQHYYMMMGE